MSQLPRAIKKRVESNAFRAQKSLQREGLTVTHQGFQALYVASTETYGETVMPEIQEIPRTSEKHMGSKSGSSQKTQRSRTSRTSTSLEKC